MKVLVTGATGFLGKEIVSELLANNFEVVIVARNGSIELSKDAVENYYPIQFDIAEREDVDSLKIFKNVDVIIHCAGLAHQFGKTSREEFFKVNVKGTENIANLAISLNVKHFILISSVSVFGKAKDKFNNLEFQEDIVCQPIGDYAESKFDAEKIVEKLCKSIDLTILRPATIIGEGDRGNVLRLIQSIDNKRFIQIGKCENYKTLVDKNYVAKVCVEIIKHKVFGVYNVANQPIKMSEILKIIYQSLGKKSFGFYIPEMFAKNIANLVDLMLKKNFSETINKWCEEDIYSQKKLETTLSNLPQVDIKERLSREVKYYINNR
jgi:nucleoside-diphosphate-sugar epimerase